MTGAAVTGHLRVVRLGSVEYADALDRQRELHAARVAGEAPDTVLLLEHPPVFTAGRRTETWERPVPEIAGAPVVDTDRGGRVTWHGPGQLVGYPVVRLPHPLDVVAYVRRLEDVLIEVCRRLGVVAGRVDGRSGVWIPENAGPQADVGAPPGGARKVAAIGVRVAQGVTMHGFALNCDPDLAWFGRIVACGITDAGVTSLSEETGRDITVTEVLPLVEDALDGMLRQAPSYAGTGRDP